MTAAVRAVQSERITFLATPAVKQRLTNQAAASGVSVAEFVRRRVMDEGPAEISGPEQNELDALLVEVNAAVPRMRAALEQSCRTLEELHRDNEDFFRERGIA